MRVGTPGEPHDNKPIRLNGAFYVLSTLLKFVAASAAEAELGELFLNMKELLSEFDGWTGYLAIGVQIASHCVLAVVYKIFFFQYIHLN